MRSTTRVGLGFAIVIGLALAVACQAAPAAPSPATAPTAAPAAKTSGGPERPKPPTTPTGRVVIGMPEIYPTLSPVELGAESRSHLYAVYDNLTKVDVDGKIVGNLAQSWRLRDDRLSWEFKLHPGVRFHDGTAADAAAVKWTFDYVMNPANRSPLISRARGFREVIAEDATTLVIRTEQPDAIVYKTAESFPLGSPAIFQQGGIDAWASRGAGSGVYQVKDIRTNVSVTLVPSQIQNPHNPRARVAEVEWRAIPESSTRVAAMRNNEIQVTFGLEVDQGKSLENERFQIVKNYTPQSLAVTMNIFEAMSDNTPVKNLKVRQAVIRSINREEITSGVFQGLVEPLYQILTPVADGYDPTLKQEGYDLPAARRLMAEAGYPNGFTSKMHVLASSAPLVSLGQAVAGYLDAIGIKVEIEQMIGTRYTELFTRGPMHPFYVSTWTHSNLDGTGALQWMVSRPTGAPVRYSNPKFDRLYEEQARELDPVRRTRILQQLNRILVEEDPIQAYITATPRFAVVSPRVYDFKMAPAKNDISEMYVAP